MDKTKKARLTKKGWTFGSAETFLGLTPEESAYIDIKLGLARDCTGRGQIGRPNPRQASDTRVAVRSALRHLVPVPAVALSGHLLGTAELPHSHHFSFRPKRARIVSASIRSCGRTVSLFIL